MAEIEVDVKILQARLRPVRARDVRPLAGGASSLTYAATTPDGDVVVKVAPAGLPPVRNRDVLRQARVLRSLAGTPLPVPAVLLEDPGGPPETPPLFVMTHVAGSSVEPLFDRDGDEPADVVAQRLRNAARAMAALHAVEPAAVGLSDDPAVSLEEEVGRWSHLLETVDPELAPDWQELASSLLASVPEPMPPAIVHGDFRLGNLLAVGSEVTAIIDWEIWSLGDPRVDVGWFLINADPETYRRGTCYAGVLPSPDELATEYGDVHDLHWFQALACFKSAATWSLIAKHNRRRAAPSTEIEEVAALLPRLVSQGAALL